MDKRLAAGVAGLVALTASAASAATTSCSTVAACIFGQNTSAGAGVDGSSKSGVGVAGTSTSGFGISAASTTNHGVHGTSAMSFGVVGITTQNATSTGTARAGVLGQDYSTNKKAFNSGVAGTSKYGIGILGQGGSYGGTFSGGGGVYTTGIGVDPDAITTAGLEPGHVVYPDTGSAIRAYGQYESIDPSFAFSEILYEGVGCQVYQADNTYEPECAPTFTVDSEGNETVGTLTAGTIVSNGSAVVNTKRASGQAVMSYGARTSSPTLEDFGKASLSHGVAYVPIEPVFASTIDATAGYMVFLTPEGNSHGLYTAQLTSRGFAVRENDGGKSSLVFDYRIVAHPADTKNARLAVMTTRHKFKVARLRAR